MTAPTRWPADADLSPLRALDLCLQQAVAQFRAAANADFQADPMRGLYISEAEIDDLLDRGSGPDRQSSAHRARLSVVADNLARVGYRLGLDPLDLDLVLVCLAPDLSSRYERLIAYLQDDATRRRPSLELLERLLDRDVVASAARLLRTGILTRVVDDRAGQASWLSNALRVDEHIVEYVCGSDAPDRRLHGWITLLEPLEEPLDVPVHPSVVPHLARLLGVIRAADLPSVICVRGAASAGSLLTVRVACAAAQRSVLVADLARLLPTLSAPSDEPLRAAVREASLHEAVLVWRGLDALNAEGPDKPMRRLLGECLAEHGEPTVMLGAPQWDPAAWWSDRPVICVDLPVVDAATRTQLWTRHLDERFPPAAAIELGERYHFVEDDAMHAVVMRAAGHAALRDDGPVGLEELIEAARAAASPPMDGLASRVEPHFGWSDLVLPVDALARLRELCGRQRFRSTVFETWQLDPSGSVREGIAGLFVGQPGTGKSMAAEVVAADLGYDLYRVDLSAVVSKYIGETEKNLEAIFRAAELGEAVLLFDEADALFGKRSEVRDSHDRYANMEVAYLLQRLERYRGVVILTSNLNGNLDDAFVRRLDCVVEFPLPEEPERRRLWERSLPDTAPRADDVDFEALARAFKLAGGHIRNACITGAFLAAADGGPIRLQHLLWGIRREYQKLGKLAADAEFDGSNFA